MQGETSWPSAAAAIDGSGGARMSPTAVNPHEVAGRALVIPQVTNSYGEVCVCAFECGKVELVSVRVNIPPDDFGMPHRQPLSVASSMDTSSEFTGLAESMQG